MHSINERPSGRERARPGRNARCLRREKWKVVFVDFDSVGKSIEKSVFVYIRSKGKIITKSQKIAKFEERGKA